MDRANRGYMGIVGGILLFTATGCNDQLPSTPGLIESANATAGIASAPWAVPPAKMDLPREPRAWDSDEGPSGRNSGSLTDSH